MPHLTHACANLSEPVQAAAITSRFGAPLVTDLDETLIRTDSLYEGILAAISFNILNLFHLTKIRSRLALKEWAAQYARPETFPINSEILKILTEAKNAGRQVWLATASSKSIATCIAAKMAIFDGVIASEIDVNLKAEIKAKVLEEKFGKYGFDYIGDSMADVPVWAVCRNAIVISSNPKVLEAAKKVNSNVTHIHSPTISFNIIFRALRMQQWIKNLLVFIPMFLAHNVSLTNCILCCAAFFSLNFCASGIYIINDLCDIPADRIHPIKKKRPFASGGMPIILGAMLIPICLGISFGISVFLPLNFTYCLLFYLICTISYSLYFKKCLFIDVIMLAALYDLRLVSGAVVLSIPTSNWLLGFSSFLFCGLALIKRIGDIQIYKETNNISRRAYSFSDMPIISGMAICAGFCSIVVMILYIDSLHAQSWYKNPEYLWIICPVIFWWYARLLILSHRCEIEDDPVSFSVRDKKSWLGAFICCAAFLLST